MKKKDREGGREMEKEGWTNKEIICHNVFQTQYEILIFVIYIRYISSEEWNMLFKTVCSRQEFIFSSACPNGTYGVRCSQNCSVTCGGPDSLCHHVDGNCSSGCDAGFTGEHCNQSRIDRMID